MFDRCPYTLDLFVQCCFACMDQLPPLSGVVMGENVLWIVLLSEGIYQPCVDGWVDGLSFLKEGHFFTQKPKHVTKPP